MSTDSDATPSFHLKEPNMKRLIAIAVIAVSLAAVGCTTTVVARPPRAGLVLVEGRWVAPPRAGAVWIAPHWERRAFHRVWIAGYWRY